MDHEVKVLIAEDDDGHAALIRRNLRRGGILNETIRLEDGQQVLDFLFREGVGGGREAEISYLLLLDIRMPRVDGMEVLRRIKQDEELRKLPVIMLTTTDDPDEVEACHTLGCNNYIVKPVDYEKFVEVIRQLGMFIRIVEVPKLLDAVERDAEGRVPEGGN